MKILNHPSTLQPDGCDTDDAPAVCVCGHEDHWHEAIGSGWWNEGACEADGCTCGNFRQYEDEED